MEKKPHEPDPLDRAEFDRAEFDRAEFDRAEFDVIVVGAGTAGAAAAAFLAEAGWSVLLTDARPLTGSGARWVNGVAPWMFDAAGVARPEPPERRAPGAFVVRGVSGRVYTRLSPSPVWPVDMRLLVARLQDRARRAGATVLAPARITAVLADGPRVTGLTLNIKSRAHTVKALLVVDASGLNAAVRRRSPHQHQWPDVPRHHLCSAAQQVRELVNPDAAQAFMDNNQLRTGDTLCQLGVSGGYSISNICIDFHSVEGQGAEGQGAGGGEVELLCGAIAEAHYRSGPTILDDTVAAHAFIGPERFGGASAIPLRRPYDRLVAPGLALLGNAACQVFSAHGSGIGMGLIAARGLADALTTDRDPGDEAVLWTWASEFMRTWGPRLVFYDLFRRASQRLDGEAVEAMVAAGLLTESGYAAGLLQQLPEPSLDDLRSMVGGAVQQPGVLGRMMPALVRIAPAMLAYQRYPGSPNPVHLRRWSQLVARAVGDPPDIPRL